MKKAGKYSTHATDEVQKFKLEKLICQIDRKRRKKLTILLTSQMI